MATPPLLPGDPAPRFVQRTPSRPDYHFDTVAGRYIVLCFFGSAARPGIREMLDRLWSRADLFDDQHAAFFGVSCDPSDETLAWLSQKVPGFRLFWDFDLTAARLYGLVAKDRESGRETSISCMTFVLDPTLRVHSVLPLQAPATHAEEIAAVVSALPRISDSGASPQFAPVLEVPRVFEPGFCRQLIALYEAGGGKDSGFMQERDGKTVEVVDYTHKRRRDHDIEDDTVRNAARARIVRRLVPEITKAYCYAPTRMERYIVSCYDAAEGGYFMPHRDNTTKGTAHRRFAVTINLNAEDYEGGDLRFPEYGRRVYRASTGGAIVFSCSLMHEATPVTRGRRYAFLPFLYDEAASRLRLANLEHIADDTLRDAIRRSTSQTLPEGSTG